MTVATAMPSDTDELRRYATANDDQAFERLVRRHVDMVYSLCLRELRGDAHMAEDATQAVFILLAQKSRQLPAGASLAGWLYQAAGYCCRNARRSVQRRVRHETEAAAQRPEMMGHTADSPSKSLEREEMAQSIHTALRRLPGREREVVLMRYFQQLTLRQVGLALGVSEDAAKQRVARAVRKLGVILGARPAPAGWTASALAAAAPAWLESHAISASPAWLAQAAAHLGLAGASTAATAASAAAGPATIAKAAAASWTHAKLITAALILAAVTATIGTAGVGWHYIAQPTKPPAIVAAPGDPVPAPKAIVTISPATAPAVDLSTPLGTLKAFSQRSKAIDADGMTELLVDDPSEMGQVSRRALHVEVAQHRLTRAMTEAFGKDVAPFQFSNPTIDQMIDILLVMPGGLDVTENGNTAAVTMHIPAMILQQIQDVRAWDGATLNMKRDGVDKPWKFDIADSIEYQAELRGGGRRKATPGELVAFLDAVIESADKVSAEVSAGLITNPTAVGPRFEELLMAKNPPIIGSIGVPRTPASKPAH